ncbi:MAG: YfbK domain-containing protein, partial [Spirochaetota bacterium]
KGEILDKLEELEAGGSTNGSAGIELAYQLAQKNFRQDGVNRIILATDGDFNVGVSSRSDLVDLIEEKAKTGIFLTVLGFGMGNYKDATVEQLADKGNGNYAYIDTLQEAKKVLVREMDATLYTIAKDVKIQVEFNPAVIKGYRLIGYENRVLADKDFTDDSKDAGEIGAGHTVTALYELIPVGSKTKVPGKIPLKYQSSKVPTNSEEALTVKLRYKKPKGRKSTQINIPVAYERKSLRASSENFRFATAVASFSMLLRDSKYKKNLSFDKVYVMAKGARGQDRYGYRREFLELVEKAEDLYD